MHLNVRKNSTSKVDAICSKIDVILPNITQLENIIMNFVKKLIKIDKMKRIKYKIKKL